jgi:hypothetical protein
MVFGLSLSNIPSYLYKPKEYIMEFLQIGGFDVQPGRHREFQAWVQDNLAGFQKSMGFMVSINE